ncbi:MAG: hypothetical protein MUO76_00340, partial [Anaerolineaceae bacterium]|nr:hypothetical protein [Anaerolineaceae bacterium]
MDKNRRLTFRINLFLISIEAIICAVILLSIPSDDKNSFLFGYSAFRLGELLVFFFVFCVSVLLLLKPDAVYGIVAGFSSITGERIWLKRSFSFLLIALCFLSFYIFFLPENNLTHYYAFHERLKPLILFVFLISLQSILSLILREHKPGITRFAPFINKNSNIIYASFFTLIIIGFIWLFIALTKIGIEPSQFWEKNGVPILFRQVFFVLLIGIWLVFIQSILREYPIPILSRLNSKNIDVILFLIIWVLTSIIWLSEPLPFNAFNPGPFPPNNSYYPYSDSAYYYSFAEWASIGQPLLQVDKPIYSTFLFILRTIASQDYSSQLSFQVIIFAIFPAILFKITRTLIHELAGLLVALLSIIHVKNTIGSSLFLWKVSHPKMMMSEFPTAILIALLILLAIYWQKIPEKSTKFAMIIGGILGISTLVRHNMWLLLPFLLFFVFLTNLSQWKKWMTFSFLVLGIMSITIMPWMLRSSKILGNPFYVLIPLKGAIYENRYLPQIDEEELDQIGDADDYDPIIHKSLAIQAALVPPENETNLGKYGILIRSVSSHFLHNIIANS